MSEVLTVVTYLARPGWPRPTPALSSSITCPIWDAWYREATRKFAQHGYIALSPNLYFAMATAPEDNPQAFAPGWHTGCPGGGRHRQHMRHAFHANAQWPSWYFLARVRVDATLTLLPVWYQVLMPSSIAGAGA